jgi:mitochondrial fission protein ELM1
VAPEHDGLEGKNVLKSKGAIHYLRNNELKENENYLKSKINKKKVVALIVGGPNKYYDYNQKSIKELLWWILEIIDFNNYQLIFIPSMRTPQKVIDIAYEVFNKNQIIIPDVDKKAYLSSLKLADHIVVTCDSTSMISEAAMTGKPIYVAQMPTIKKNYRFKKFFELFKSLNIIRDLPQDLILDSWNYEKLNETDRISRYIKEKFKDYDFS